MNKLALLVGFSALLAFSPAKADDPVSDKSQSTYTPGANGGYTTKDSMEHTDAAGTTTSRESEKKVDVDASGNKSTTVDLKSSTDPKGLMNKTTTEVKNTATEKNGKTEYTHKKTVNGKTVEQSDDQQQ